MTDPAVDPLDPTSSTPDEAPRELTPAAVRALAEAAERRRQAEQRAQRPLEIGGSKGPDPIRYGDWETGGIASDF